MHPTHAPSPPWLSVRRTWRRCGAASLCLVGALACWPAAQAQLVPPTAHAWRQMAQNPYTTVHLPWRPHSPGLQANGRQLWPQWEGRIGVVIDRPVNPLKDNFVLAQPITAGLQLRSLHILSDYHVAGGFRATAGVLRGRAEEAWWTGSSSQGGLNLSLQRLDSLRLPNDHPDTARIMAYVGAGYSMSLGDTTTERTSSHFNADIGLTATGQREAQRPGVSATDGLGGNPLSGKLEWRPLIKVSVDYAF